MDAQEFAYWLQGHVEISGGAMPTEAGWEVIKHHLALVFHKVTPGEAQKMMDELEQSAVDVSSWQDDLAQEIVDKVLPKRTHRRPIARCSTGETKFC